MLKKIIDKFKPQQLPMYQILGEERGTYELVKNFYDYMETEPSVKDCLEVHELVDGKIPDEVKKKLFMFLCGWLGGPNIFVETYGPPRMRARHMHVKIGAAEKDQWLQCMDHAIKVHSYKISKKNKTLLFNSFTALAMRIQNA